MCKQTQHLFQEVCQEKQPSHRIINDEYRINVTQFRTTIHKYCQKIKFSCHSQEISKQHLFHRQLASMSIS
jgi:hypothetical protein